MERRGCGAYGVVYRAFSEEGASGPVALKLALHSGDQRFAREVELLSRIRSPNVPRLVGHGSWRQPGGTAHPFLVLEWVEGMSLYEWAHVHRPTSRQVLHALADLARALAATHAAGGVHRDVKGGNVLVSAEEGQVFLTDFGSGHYVGAATLTSPPFPPGTPAYRSPEAWRSVHLPLRESATPYAPGPADDVFALGVTAYRLVTGEYPLTTDPTAPESHVWSQEGTGAWHPRVVNVRCCVELSEVVSRMLSVHPEARGSARELAEALEQAADEAGPEADAPLSPRDDSPLMVARSAPRPVVHRSSVPPGWALLTAASLGGAVAMGAGWMLSTPAEKEAEPQVHVSAPEESKDGGTVAVGDSALTAPMPLVRAPTAWSTIALEVPPRPFPGQIRPDAAGRCRNKSQVPINGGCWVKLSVAMKDCDENINWYVYKGACYGPALLPARPPTSGPTQRSGDDAP